MVNRQLLTCWVGQATSLKIRNLRPGQYRKVCYQLSNLHWDCDKQLWRQLLKMLL